jgi:hypothetical protein
MPIAKSKLSRLAAGTTPPNMVGTWTSELNSTMVITAQTGSTFTGTYTNQTANGGSVQGTLAGVVSGESVGWSVSWQPTSDSTQSWTGKFVTAGGVIYIYALWYLSSGDQTVPVWESIMAGDDIFGN